MFKPGINICCGTVEIPVIVLVKIENLNQILKKN
jgi:hypothetical protein